MARTEVWNRKALHGRFREEQVPDWHVHGAGELLQLPERWTGRARLPRSKSRETPLQRRAREARTFPGPNQELRLHLRGGHLRNLLRLQSGGLVCASQQVSEIIIDACDTEVRLAREGPANITNSVPLPIKELDQGQNEVVRLVQRVEDLVLGYRDRVGSCHATLHLDKA